MNRTKVIKRITTMAMFSTLAYVFSLVAHFLGLAIVPSLPFLTYDPKDIIICISGFILGPLNGFIISVIVSFIEMITISSTGIYGFIMNIVSTCALVVPAALIYKHMKSFKGAFISLLVGFLSAIIVMTLWNIIITPIYMDIPRNVLVKNYLGLIVLFNVIKDGINIALILVLYKPIITGLRATHLVDPTNAKMDKKNTLIMIGVGLLLLITLIAAWILIQHYL